ncbi:hypothetical protein O4H66_19730 [Comamonadaceae bacterium G21597-S1]|nr:hypothetical protein [Comamonadaceae bacterium G21597-S1]
MAHLPTGLTPIAMGLRSSAAIDNGLEFGYGIRVKSVGFKTHRNRRGTRWHSPQALVSMNGRLRSRRNWWAISDAVRGIPPQLVAPIRLDFLPGADDAARQGMHIAVTVLPG